MSRFSLSRIQKYAGQLLAATAVLGAIWSSQVVASSDEELKNFKEAIRAKYDLKELAFANNDPEPILTKFYSEDVISTDFEGKTHVGRDELRPIYERVIADNVRIESYRSVVNGNAGWDWANFHVQPADSEMKPFTFKMLFLWEKIDGEWWSHGEMYAPGEFEIK